LPIPSIVRAAKLATIEARDAQRLGTLSPADRVAVSRSLRDWLATVLDLD
jgi:mRNA interferase MazF